MGFPGDEESCLLIVDFQDTHVLWEYLLLDSLVLPTKTKNIHWKTFKVLKAIFKLLLLRTETQKDRADIEGRKLL